jgi:hypothetical protein
MELDFYTAKCLSLFLSLSFSLSLSLGWSLQSHTKVQNSFSKPSFALLCYSALGGAHYDSCAPTLQF